MYVTRLVGAAMLIALPAFGQATSNPFQAPIAATDGAITVNFVEFASIPDISGEAPRMMCSSTNLARGACSSTPCVAHSTA